MQSVDVQAFKDVLKRCLATCQDGDLVQVACPLPDTQTSGLTYGGAISHIAVGSVTQFSACRARGVGVAGRPAAAGSGDPVATRPFDVFRQQRASAVRAVADEIPRRGTARDRVVRKGPFRVHQPMSSMCRHGPEDDTGVERRARVRHCPLLCGTKCLCVGKAASHGAAAAASDGGAKCVEGLNAAMLRIRSVSGIEATDRPSQLISYPAFAGRGRCPVARGSRDGRSPPPTSGQRDISPGGRPRRDSRGRGQGSTSATPCSVQITTSKPAVYVPKEGELCSKISKAA